MAGTGSQPPASSPRPLPRPVPPAAPQRKPPQVLMIRKDEPRGPTAEPESAQPQRPAANPAQAPERPAPAATASPARSDEDLFDMGAMEGLTMADLLGPDSNRRQPPRGQGQPREQPRAVARSVDDFDFDEQAFLAALEEQDFVGTTGEVVSGTVVGLESDGVYVDIGGKAPGFMPKKEAGLGVITNLKERFPKGMQLEVLVTREQNADGMVTVS
ncbi:MAG: S1 RNA-binding domain-containing protein, partial [Cyanobacteriota bacterium]|nr:S1 RNA-binding domain-containing protein [Cyanobacteriota bacterium]